MAVHQVGRRWNTKWEPRHREPSRTWMEPVGELAARDGLEVLEVSPWTVKGKHLYIMPPLSILGL